MISKTKTHVQVMKTKYRLNKAQLIESCGITDEHYAEFMFETGIAWIKENLWNDERAISLISSSPVFWDWFSNEWNLRDDRFIMHYLNYVLSGQFSEILYAWWTASHEVRMIKGFPQGDKWDRLVSSVIKHAGKEAVNA